MQQTQLSTGQRDVLTSMWRGFICRCPACGQGNLFRAYLKVADRCPVCAEELYHHRADDAPPYFTITIVGHVVIGGILVMERVAHPPTWLQSLIWVPLALIMCLALLPAVKGSLVGLQWALRMHGFAAVPNSSTGATPIHHSS